MSPIWGLSVAVMGVITGLIWRLPWGGSKDLACFQIFNRLQIWAGFDWFFIFSRALGTKWALLFVLGVILLWDIKLGITLCIAALLMAGFERGIKYLIKRPRPFMENPESILRQNPAPQDPSFPSGDATRVWFILAVLLFGIHSTLLWIVITAVSVAAVSLGRVRLGVHYPLDVFAGACLGFGSGMIWSSIMM
jgi:undecaprenyl-diphosphatase